MRRKQTPICVAAGFLALAIGASSAAAQDLGAAIGDRVDRDGRVVVFSPHFDEPLPQGGALSCPAGPMHLYGFESDEADQHTLLQVRVFSFMPTRLSEDVVPPDGRPRGALAPIPAMVRLTARIEGGNESPLPVDPMWARMADSTGLAVFTVPSGVYGIRVEGSGYRGGDGVIRVRSERADSIHVYLMVQAICEASAPGSGEDVLPAGLPGS